VASGWGCVGWRCQPKARHGSLLHSASTPELQAALPGVCLKWRMRILLGRFSADPDSDRGREQRVFIRKMRPFEDSHTFASHQYAGVEDPYGVLNTKPHLLSGDVLLPVEIPVTFEVHFFVLQRFLGMRGFFFVRVSNRHNTRYL
jgi:hypothetical protein